MMTSPVFNNKNHLQTRISRCFLLLWLVFFLTLQAANAQKKAVINLPKYDYKAYHFGFILAVNAMDFRIKYEDDFRDNDSLLVLNSTPQGGFNIGIVSNLRLADHWDLRFVPTLSFGERDVAYTFIDTNNVSYDDVKKVESTLIDFPLTVKFKSNRLNNTRAYVLTGLKYSIDLASQAKKREKDENVKVKLSRDDISFEVGVGFDFYTTFFKFGTELKMSYGINDLIVKEGTIYTQHIKKLSSKVFQLSFTFE
jgi:hypothetical protein